MLRDGFASDQARSLGIGEPLLVAPAGTYPRVPPVFADTDRATAATRQQFDIHTRVLAQTYGAIHCIALRGATLVGQGSVITRNDILLWESAAEFLAHRRTPDGLRDAGDDRWQVGHQPTRHIDAPCLLVKRPWFRNFGHWLVDCATVLSVMGETAQRLGWMIVVGATDDAMMQRIVLETITRVAPGVPVLEHPDHEAWHFADLRYVMPLHVPPLFKLPAALQRLRTLLLEPRAIRSGIPRPRARRIYLPRRGAGVRIIVNEVELAALLTHFGFETVEPRGLSLSDQARLFNQAEAVIGIKGAALANIIFCEAPCAVMVLSPADFPDPFFWDIAGQMGLRYAELFGPITTALPAGRNDFVVDFVAVARMLGSVLPGDASRISPGH